MTLVVRRHCNRDSELYCYNTEGDRNSLVNQESYRMGGTLLQLEAEIDIEKRTIHNILWKIFICVKFH